MTSATDVVLEARGISKIFPGVRALDNVSIRLRRGRLTALLGENGAGKSTLMNIIAGVFPPDGGEIQLDGEPVTFSCPRAALDAGIAMIYQELNLVADMTIAENIFLGREPLNAWGLIDAQAMNTAAQKILQQLQLNLTPTTPLNQLRVGQQQLVEIAKAISCNARVIIMDEPTSAITEQEIEALFSIIENLKQQGVAIAYITHKFEELTRIGDDAIVMRDGKLITTAAIGELSRDEMVRLMVGRDLETAVTRAPINATQEILRVENLSLKHPSRAQDFILKNISFSAHRGEVLGIFGLMGAGRTELLETIFGLHPRTSSGAIFINNNAVSIKSPDDAIAQGIALAPEDRKHEGIILGMTIAENASLACLKKMERWGIIDQSAEQQLANNTIARFNVKTPSCKQLIRNLSGGNQQKVILGKWLAIQPDILLLDEPTRGIDINAKTEIYKIIHELSDSGICVILVSSEIPEILALSDRIMVLSEGKKTAEFYPSQTTAESIISAALPLGASNT